MASMARAEGVKIRQIHARAAGRGPVKGLH
jgi:hypothetical protein